MVSKNLFDIIFLNKSDTLISAISGFLSMLKQEEDVFVGTLLVDL
jgi:hypothetical protein